MIFWLLRLRHKKMPIHYISAVFFGSPLFFSASLLDWNSIFFSDKIIPIHVEIHRISQWLCASGPILFARATCFRYIPISQIIVNNIIKLSSLILLVGFLQFLARWNIDTWFIAHISTERHGVIHIRHLLWVILLLLNSWNSLDGTRRYACWNL